MKDENKLTTEQQIKKMLKEPHSGDNIIQKNQKEIFKKELEEGKHDNDPDLKRKIQKVIGNDEKNESN